MKLPFRVVHPTRSRTAKIPKQHKTTKKADIAMSSTLEELPVECKQLLWSFFGFQELCRVAQVSQMLQRGVDTRVLWRRRALELLQDEQRQMEARTGLLGNRLQRGFASRDLLATGEAPSVIIQIKDDDIVDEAVDWKRWFRDTFQSLTVFTAANAGFTTGVNELQELKTERAALKEALQAAKSSAHADKRTRRVQMHCVRWMNRSHRRRTATASSQQAHMVQLSRAELNEELQIVEADVQTRGKELFSLRSRALKSLHRLNTQLAEGTLMFNDLYSRPASG